MSLSHGRNLLPLRDSPAPADIRHDDSGRPVFQQFAKTVTRHQSHSNTAADRSPRPVLCRPPYYPVGAFLPTTWASMVEPPALNGSHRAGSSSHETLTLFRSSRQILRESGGSARVRGAFDRR